MDFLPRRAERDETALAQPVRTDVAPDAAALVHIIDDDESIREALEALLSTVQLESRIYATAQEFLTAGCPDMPGCILLDVRLPGGQTGLELQEHFLSLGILLPVVLITGYGDVEMSVRAMKAGAIDFLTKPLRAQDLIEAVSRAIQRDRQRRILAAARLLLEERFRTLTQREKLIMALVTAGDMNKQVAWKLGITEAATKLSRGSLMRKMDALSLADLIRMADQLGLREVEGNVVRVAASMDR
jgi:FixJ family two-component response regulator